VRRRRRRRRGRRQRRRQALFGALRRRHGVACSRRGALAHAHTPTPLPSSFRPSPFPCTQPSFCSSWKPTFVESMGWLSLAAASASPSENAHQGRSLSTIASSSAPSPASARCAERRGSTTLQKPNPALPSISPACVGAAQTLKTDWRCYIAVICLAAITGERYLRAAPRRRAKKRRTHGAAADTARPRKRVRGGRTRRQWGCLPR
jgi:hypothetical protein